MFILGARSQQVRGALICLLFGAVVVLLDHAFLQPPYVQFAVFVWPSLYQVWLMFSRGPGHRPGLLLGDKGVEVRDGRSVHLVEWGAIADVAVISRWRRQIQLVGCSHRIPVPFDSRWLPDRDFDAKVAEVREEWIRRRPPSADSVAHTE